MFGIASNTIEDNHILLTTLERVDSVNFKCILNIAALVSTQSFKPLIELSDLRFIWRDYTDLPLNILERPLQRHFSCHKIDEHLGEISLFHVTFTLIIIDFFRMLNIKEDHSATEDSCQIRNGQRSTSESNRLVISNCSTIELLRGECPDLRVHSKLDGKHCLLIAAIQ